MKQVIAFLIAIFLKVNVLFASHAMGGEITYQHLVNNDYILTYTFYRDCSGIGAPGAAIIKVTSSCYSSFNITLFPAPNSPIEISPVCPGELSTCNGGSSFGVQKWIYSDTITLPGRCNDWIFSKSECCRNFITTSNNASDMYVYSVLNNAGNINNSSPIFLNNSTPFVCLGQRSCFNPGAFDPDGDSLTYRLGLPMSTLGVITYLPGYSASQPIQSNPPVTFDLTTGDMCMTPTQFDISIFALVITEYRNGVFVGQVERDIQIQVINCNNSLPSLSGINGTPSFQAYACAGRPFSFWIKSSDGNSIDTTKITWDNSLPGATLTTFGTYRDSAVFSWVPPITSSNQTFCFTITVKDDHCPYFGTQTYSYCIKVSLPKVYAGSDQIIFCGNYTSLSAVGAGGIPSYTYVWDDTIVGQTLSPTGPGQHIVAIIDSIGCINFDTVNVYADSSSIIRSIFDVDSSCEDEAVVFTNLSTGGGINNYQWNFGDGTTSNSQNPSPHTYLNPGLYITELFISNIFGCKDSITDTIAIYPKPTVSIGDFFICYGDVIELEPITNATSFNWSTGATTSNIYVSPANLTTYSVNVTNVFGCTNADSSTVNVYPIPEANFIIDSLYYVNDNVFIQDSSFTLNGSIVSWTWEIDSTISYSQNINYMFSNAGNYTVSLIVIDEKQCTDTIFKTIIIEDPYIAVYIPNSFSPNEDGKNDYFKVYGTNLTKVKVEIFDRWGIYIYSWEGINGGWNGTYKGEVVQNDTYVYKVYIEGIKGFKKEYTGKITIIK